MGSYHRKVRPLVDRERWLITGVSAIDDLCGRGIPRGTYLQLYGEQKSRKTTAALIMLRAAQRSGWVTVYYNIEAGFLDQVALRLGIDFDEPTYHLNGEEIEDPGDNPFSGANGKKVDIVSPGLIFMEAYETNTIERMFEHAKRVTVSCVRNGLTPLFVADAMSSLSTSQEEWKSFSGDTMMEVPKRTRLGYKLFQKPLAKCGGIFVAIDHKKPTGSAGSGSAPGFFASTRLDFTLMEELPDPNDPEEKSLWFMAEIVAAKSRHAASGRSMFAFDYKPTEFDEDGEAVRRFGPDLSFDLQWCGQRIGLYEKSGGYFKLPENFPEGPVTVHGEAKWPELYDRLRRYPAWIEAMKDLYHIGRWYEWCADAGKDAHEEMKKFGDEVYKRFVKAEKAAYKTAGLKKPPRRRKPRAKSLDQEMAEVEAEAKKPKAKAKAKAKTKSKAKPKAKSKGKGKGGKDA